MKRFKPWLLLLLVFLAGFAGGVVVTRGVVRHLVREAINDPNFVREKIERRMAVKLRLDRDQRSKVHDILVKTQGNLKSLRQEFQPRFLTLMSEAQSEIMATLGPEQRQRFEEFERENRHLWAPR